MQFWKNKIAEKLAQQRAKNTLRKLSTSQHLVDFSSNDYLGLARLSANNSNIINLLSEGSTGSRLLTGNSVHHEALETYLAKFHNAEAALLFNSGYDANIGIVSALTDRHDTILYDQYVHASLRDGIKMSPAKAFNWRHNDLEHLEQRLQKVEGSPLVIAESVYSMDGDEAPLIELVSLCEKYQAALLLDEAHAVGVFGPEGRGLAAELHLEDAIFARIVTFGKAIGAHGAAVLGSTDLREYLINFARSLIYTTALPPTSVAAIQRGYEAMQQLQLTDQLKDNINLFINELERNKISQYFIPSRSAIQCCVVTGNAEVRAAAAQLQAQGFDVRPILAPTVPAGQERLRICLHAFNTKAEIVGVQATLVALGLYRRLQSP